MVWTYIDTSEKLVSALPKIDAMNNLCFDTETTGLDPYIDKVILAQIGNASHQFLIDTRKVDPSPLAPILEDPRRPIIMHNGKFDYKMMKANFGIECECIRDTMVVAKLIDNGRRTRGFKLSELLQDHLGIEIDKSLQKSWVKHEGDFSEAQLNYAATDIAHLSKLKEKYQHWILRDGLENVALLECNCIPCFGDMELYGLLLNVGEWEKILKENEEAARLTALELDEIARGFYKEDMFGNVNINYNSPDRVTDLLQKMKIRIIVEDRKGEPVLDRHGNIVTRKITDTSDETLKLIKDLPVTKLIKKYRKHTKLVGTYGRPFLNAVHPVTGRLHPLFKQLGAETGRITSDSDSPVNMLNIPRDKRMRNCFIAPEDYVIETDDYSGCELRILAHMSQDNNLIVPLQRGDDMHCTVASQLYGIPVTKSNENAHLRSPAKNLNFGIIYGMQPGKLYLDLNALGFPITLQETRKLFNKYCEVYHCAVGWIREQGKLAAHTRGGLRNSFGRVRYWVHPNPDNRDTFPLGEEDRKYLGVLNSIERAGGNFPIQSTNADITKYAMVLIRNHIKKNKIRSNIMLQVYDEIVTCTHKDDSPDFVIKKRELMIEAGQRWVSSVPIEVEGHVLPYWTK